MGRIGRKSGAFGRFNDERCGDAGGQRRCVSAYSKVLQGIADGYRYGLDYGLGLEILNVN